MASEVEIKLELAAGVADQIATLPWLRDLISGPAVTKQLVSVYFDTAKQKLRAHGLTLRVRQVGNKHLQTIKTADLGTHGAFGRDEWEHEVADTRPDLTRAEGTALEKLATPTLERKLRPVFETVIERTAIPLHYDGAALELALDRGVIHGNGSHEAVDEVEIELKQGDPAVLAAVAERLARSVPVSFGVRTKSERGYALCNGETGEAVQAAPIMFDRAATAGDAFTAIGLSCLKHIVSNREAVIAGRAAGVHQMRAGLRRLRAAIAIFKLLLRDAEAKSVKRELKWLAGQLEPGVARKAVESDRFRELGLRTALWLANGCVVGRQQRGGASRTRPVGHRFRRGRTCPADAANRQEAA